MTSPSTSSPAAAWTLLRRLPLEMRAGQELLAYFAANAVMAQSLCLAYAEAGQPDKSIEWLEQACAIDQSFGPARYNLGMAYRNAGRPNDALQPLEAAARRALAVDRNYNPAAQWLAERGMGPP